MTLRLSDEETEALRATAQSEGRSMQETAKAAIAAYTSKRESRMRTMFQDIANRDAEAMKLLGS